jgi:hypothetical protein
MIRLPTLRIPTVRLPFNRWDVCTAAGALAVAVGAGMVYRPAGIILGGTFLMVTGLLGAAHAGKGGAG